MIRNLLPSKQETWVPLGGEDPLEKEMATHSSILAWETPWAEEPGRTIVHGVTKESDTTQWLSTYLRWLSGPGVASRVAARREELPHVQGKERQLSFAGAAAKKYYTSKVRETQVRW